MSLGSSRKTINRRIKKKMTEVMESLPEELQADFKKDVIVTGGCIASMLLGEDVNDYDVYFRRYETAVKFSNHYLKQFLDNRKAEQGGVQYDMEVQEVTDSLNRQRVRIVVKSAGIAGEQQTQDYEYFEVNPDDDDTAGEYAQEAFGNVSEEAQEEKPKYHPVFLSSNAITLKGDVQIVIRFQGDHEQIHENFDFLHCMNWWTFKDGVQFYEGALECLLSRTLIYQGSLYPVCSVFRVKKFVQRGWKINAGQMLKMCLQISNLDLTNPLILEEQLTGVDAAYFNEILKKAEQRENPLVIETAYLTEIIDRMFS